MMELDKMIDQYAIDNFRNELLADIEDTQQETLYMSQANNRNLDEVLDLVR